MAYLWNLPPRSKNSPMARSCAGICSPTHGKTSGLNCASEKTRRKRLFMVNQKMEPNLLIAEPSDTDLQTLEVLRSIDASLKLIIDLIRLGESN